MASATDSLSSSSQDGPGSSRIKLPDALKDGREILTELSDASNSDDSDTVSRDSKNTDIENRKIKVSVTTWGENSLGQKETEHSKGDRDQNRASGRGMSRSRTQGVSRGGKRSNVSRVRKISTNSDNSIVDEMPTRSYKRPGTNAVANRGAGSQSNVQRRNLNRNVVHRGSRHASRGNIYGSSANSTDENAGEILRGGHGNLGGGRRGLSHSRGKTNKDKKKSTLCVTVPSNSSQTQLQRTQRKENRITPSKPPQKKSDSKECSLLVKFNNPQKLKEIEELLIPHLVSHELTMDNARFIEDGSGEATNGLIEMPSLRKAKTIQGTLKDTSIIASMEIIVNGDPCVPINREKMEVNLRIEIMELHQEKVTEQDRKIANVQSEIETLQPKKKKQGKTKFVVLDEYERRKALLETLDSKKDDLVAQVSEFKHQLQNIEKKLNEIKVIKSDKDFQKEINDIRHFYKLELERFTVGLPMYAKRGEIIKLIEENQVSVILGETGSGKSTQMVQYLYNSDLGKDKLIVCTQPRKIAAVSLAKRVAEEMKVEVGGLVGFSTGMASKRSKITRVIYATDHMLLNECIKDPLLKAYSFIIIDEAHERTVQTDLLLGMLKRCLVQRPELRLVITSATIDPEPFVKYFNGCPVLRVSGRLFPVDVQYSVGTSSDKDFLRDAVEKVVEIHTTEPPGDILVFLTTPGETEKACDMLKQDRRSKDTIALPLHGKLQAEDQQKAFIDTPKGMRKVLFATNIGETSITIAGIKYVVDSGFSKQLTYNPVTDFSGLKVAKISKSSADQRKGRAGRTDCGKCFRLYTAQDYNDMDPMNSPEILRVHISQALLKLLALGIENPAEFDFVQPPPREALSAAVSTLDELGATVDGKLTPLGKKLSRIPLPPRMAKAVLLSIDAGVGFEMAISLTMCTLSQSVFFRVGSIQEKAHADKLKARLCHKYGDVLTYTEIYKEWFKVGEKMKSKWCVENSINAKSMRIARDAVKELTSSMKYDANIQLHQTFNPDLEPPTLAKTMCSIMCQCFMANLCYYSGHSRTGYFIAGNPDRTLVVHPSSALINQGQFPKWVVYLQVLTTSQNFMLNVTRVDEEWLEELIESKLINLMNLETLQMLEMKRGYVSHLGIKLLRKLCGPSHANIRELEDSIKSEVDAKFALEVDFKNSRLVFYCPSFCQNVALGMLQKRVNSEKESLKLETFEIALTPQNPIRLLLGGGGFVMGINLPGDYHKVILNDVPIKIDIECITRILTAYGEVCNLYKISSGGNSDVYRAVVTFTNYETAAKVLQASKEQMLPFNAKPDMAPNSMVALWPFKLKFQWLRRKTYGKGTIEFRGDYWKDFQLDFSHFRVAYGRPFREKMIGMRWLTEPHCIFANLHNVPLVCDESDVKRFLEDELDSMDLPYDENDIKVVLYREKAPPINQYEVISKEHALKAFICENIGSSCFLVNMYPPREKDYFYQGWINLRDVESVNKIVESGDYFTPSPDGKIKFEKHLEASFQIQPHVYHLIKNRLQSKINRFARNFGALGEFRPKKIELLRNGRFSLKFTTSSVELFARARDEISECINGKELPYSAEDFKVLCSQMGQTFLKSLAPKCHSLTNKRANCLQIFVDSDECAIEESIKAFILSAQYHEIELAEEGRPPGLLRQLLIEYGPSLTGLRENSGATYLDLNLRHHQLLFWGSSEALEKLVRKVDVISKALHPGNGCMAEITGQLEDECPICLCPVAARSVYYTEYCGHAYCKECVTSMIRVAIGTKEMPIVCIKEDCGAAFCVADIMNILGSTIQCLQHLTKCALDVYVAQNSNLYNYCSTPDCPSVYRVSDEGDDFTCPVCGVNCCTRCHKTPGHMGMTCIQEENINELQNWLAADKANRALCPKCNSPIEKNGGCMHMTCTQCKPNTHICWRCKRDFMSEDETYTHLAKCRADGSTGGIFGNEH